MFNRLETRLVKIGLIMTLAGMAMVGLSDVEAQKGTAVQKDRISVRTENFPRPPYSGATYYIYERNGEVICTKLEVCNKFDDCDTEYRKGVYKDPIDVETGDPYGKTDAVFIPTAKLRKHVCLTKFKLLSK
jgi:hypothetical protein